MAGESPDKSEQRKSSGEATQEADPRFAVFRESAATGGAGSGEADEATADADKDAPPTANGSSATPEPPADRSAAVSPPRGTRAASEAPEAAEAPVTASEGSPRPEPEAEPAGDTPLPEPEPDAEPELESTTEPKSDVAPANPDPEAAERELARRARDERESATGVAPPKAPVPDQKTAVFKALKPAGRTGAEPASDAAAEGPASAPTGDVAPAKRNVEPDAPAKPGGSAPETAAASAGSDASVRSDVERGGAASASTSERGAAGGEAVSAERDGSASEGKSASAGGVAPAEPEAVPGGSAPQPKAARPSTDDGASAPGAGAVPGGTATPGSGGDPAKPEAQSAGSAPKSASASVGGDAPAELETERGGSALGSKSERASAGGEAVAAERDGSALEGKSASAGGVAPAEPDAQPAGSAPETAAASGPGGSGRPVSGSADAVASATESKSGQPVADEAASGSGADAGEAVDRKTSVFKALKTPPAAGEATPGTAGREAGPSGTAPATTGAAAEGEQGVDRKTAAFKALKRPQTDQPTAMLKLPPQPAAPGAEAPAERTSRFVPLKPDEVRAPAKPEGVPEAERTRQQPMPPLPPLDLLAELTNKPAPPETPTRTVVRRVKIWTPLLVLVLIIFAVVQAMRPAPTPSLNLTAKSTYSFDGDKPALPWPGEGQGFMAATGLGTVGSFGEQKAVPIGSVAKAMTAYVILKDKPLKRGAKGPSIEVDAKAEEDGGLDAQGESTLNTVKEGDTLTQHDALAALMIPSANNIARLLARWDSNGSEAAFVKKMNDTAAELGMKNTKYTDPSGLNATTVSSAEDQVKLGQKLVEIPALMDITKLPEWTDPSGKKWRNYNTLVPYDGALGIKTGSTTKAGGNLLFAAHKVVGDTDQLIVGAVLGQHKSPIIDTVNAVSKDVMLATQNELEAATIVKKGTVVGEVDNGLGTTVPLVATKDVKAVGWSGLTVKLELADGGESVPLTAAAGTHVGTLTVGEGKSQVEVAVALQGDLAEASFTDKLTRVG